MSWDGIWAASANIVCNVVIDLWTTCFETSSVQREQLPRSQRRTPGRTAGTARIVAHHICTAQPSGQGQERSRADFLRAGETVTNAMVRELASMAATSVPTIGPSMSVGAS
jgi:hypothetical protein